MAFRIEEDAYERLSSYLEALESRLKTENDDSETINDIEARIAELFSSVVHTTDRAVTISDVEDVIKTIGKPEDFGSQEDEAESEKKKDASWRSRRLYRDPNNRILGGVCSGLSAYFNIDPIIFRILFILGFFAGILFVAYILLWMIIPKANTIEQHAQMTAGYNNSSRRRKNVNKNFGELQKDAKLINTLKTLLGVLIVAFTTLTLFAMTIGFFIFNFGVLSVKTDVYKLWTSELIGLFLDPTAAFYTYIGIGLIIFIPVILIFYSGLHLIFNFKRGGKLIGLAGFLLWLTGIGFVVYAALSTAAQFREHTSVSQTVVLQPFEGDTLYLKYSPLPSSKTLFHINRLRISVRDKIIEKDDRITLFKNRIAVEGKPYIHINKDAEKFAITIERESYGSNVEQAEEYASKIEFFWIQENNELLIDRIYSLPENVPIRGQKLNIKIETPEGKEVKMSESVNKKIRK